jgi:hypothetical protein
VSLAAESVLTFLGNLGGYALAFLVVVHATRRQGEGYVKGFPAAATALFILWSLTMAAYVGTEYLIERSYQHEDSVPLWLDSSNGISENIQSEVIQIWIAALIFKYLRWPGSPESQ